MMGPLCPISIQGSPVTLLKFQMAPRLILLMSSGSKKREPRYTCLSEVKASHSHRMWAEVSNVAPHLLHSGWRYLLKVLCPVRRPVMTLVCVLLKDRNLAMAPGQGPKINSQACLCQMLVNQTMSNPSSYILPRDSQSQLRSNKL